MGKETYMDKGHSHAGHCHTQYPIESQTSWQGQDYYK